MHIYLELHIINEVVAYPQTKQAMSPLNVIHVTDFTAFNDWYLQKITFKFKAGRQTSPAKQSYKLHILPEIKFLKHTTQNRI